MAETKVAWVTGGSAGIGLAIAKALAADGYLSIISARTETPLREAATQVGQGCESLVCDVTDRTAVTEACAEILRRHGRIDVLVNNAGGNSQKREWSDLAPEEFEAVIATNINGTFNTIHAVLPSMRERKNGLVINISSGAGKQVGLGAGVAYTIAKHGVHIMSKLLNLSELANGIRCCVITPAFVRTGAHDWRPVETRNYMLDPDDVARAVRFAIDSPSHTMIQEIDLAWSPV